MAEVWVLRLVVISLVVTCSLGFVLRRRDWEDDADMSLAEALPVLREERRRLEERPPLEGATSFWSEAEIPEEEESLELEPRLSIADENGVVDSFLGEDGNLGRYFMPNMGFEDEEDDVENTDLLNDTEDDINDDVDDDDSITEITKSPADLKELETILEPSDDEKQKEQGKSDTKDKKNIPVALGGPGPDRSKREEKVSEGMSDLNSLLEKTAEKLGTEALLGSSKLEEDEDDQATPVPVSKDELEAVLKDEDEDEEDEEAEEDDNEVPWKRTREEVLPALSYTAMVPLKIKRSSRKFPRTNMKRATQMPDDGGAAREYIRRFLELEDDENTNLANALNLATMAQVQRDDKLVIPEAKFIKKAIEDEQAIQELRAELTRDSDLDENPVVTAAEAIAKREKEFEPEISDNELDQEDDDDDEDVQQEVEYIPEDIPDEEEEENMIQEVSYGGPAADLAEKLREYLKHTNALQQENEVAERLGDSLQGGSWLDRPIEMGQEGITEDEWELNPLLRELYQRYAASQLSKRGQPQVNSFGPEVEEFDPLEDGDIGEDEEEETDNEEDPSPGEIEDIEEEIENTLEDYIQSQRLKEELQREEQLVEEETGLCPALELVDGCHYAVGNLGLKLDAEAMDLCNRHQLCYTCGAAHGLTATDCDNGYLQEANRLCEIEGNEDDCSTDAAGLFILMLQSHQFYSDEREVPSACHNPCTMDYVVGLDKK